MTTNSNRVTHHQVVCAIQTYGLNTDQSVDYQLVQMRDVLEEYEQSRSAISDADTYRNLLVEWLDGMYDGQDYLRRVKLACGTGIAAIAAGGGHEQT